MDENNYFESNPSCDYCINSINITNIEEPWREIAEKEDCPVDYVVIDPVRGLDIVEYSMHEDNRYSNYYGAYTTYKASSQYIDRTIDNDVTPFSVTVAKVNCLKSNVAFRYVEFSMFTAMNDFFYYINDSTYKKMDYKPYIIINTKHDSRLVRKKDIEKMVNEITAAYVNNFHDYPIIFIAYIQDENLTIEEVKKIMNKQKNNKKGNK